MRPELSHVIPERSIARVVIGSIGAAVAFGAAKHFLERPPALNLRSHDIEPQPGEIIEAESFLEVGPDHELQFHGPDPRLPEPGIVIFNNQDLLIPSSS